MRAGLSETDRQAFLEFILANCKSQRLIWTWKGDKLNPDWSTERDFLLRTGHNTPNAAPEV